MKLLFCLNHYFPFGGLERDCLRIAQACAANGANGDSIEIITQKWEGPKPENIAVHCKPVHALTNYGASRKFARVVKKFREKNNFDAVIGFNKMPGLDIYYAADPCYREKFSHLNMGKWLNPRHWAYLALERAVFAQNKKTQILLLNPQHQSVFTKYYQTSPTRFHLLAPSIGSHYRVAETPSAVRIQHRHHKGIGNGQKIILFVASFFKPKGLDRALIALASLPEAMRDVTQLWVIGKDNPEPYRKKIQQLGIGTQVKFLGASESVPEYMLIADLLLHPAYHEVAGMVLLEALAAGLPVITTQICGYAHYVAQASAGMVMPEPFVQQHLNQALADGLENKLTHWREQAQNFSRTADIYHTPQEVAGKIHSLVKQS